jgi:hypothetical protein
MKTTLTIPEISDERLAELAKRIRPVVRSRSNALAYIEPCDLRRVSFIWDAKITRKASKLVKHATIRTLHTYGYYGLFKPSIAEVLAQIPEDLIEQTVAFEVIGPKDASDLNREQEALNAGFHVAVTHLYGKASR